MWKDWLMGNSTAECINLYGMQIVSQKEYTSLNYKQETGCMAG